MPHKYLIALLAIAACVALLAMAIRIGQFAGREDARLSIERLDLVFGNVLSLPETDRALLVKLSMTCRLSTRPLTRNETIACLREATTAPSLNVPANMLDPKTHLDSLLKSVPQPIEAPSQTRV